MRRVKYYHNRDIVDIDYDVKIRSKDIENVKELKNCKSLADVFSILAELYAYVVYKPKGLKDKNTQEGYYRRELALAKDIRFDYVNKQIYIPVCRYSYNIVNEEAIKHFHLGNIKKLGYSIGDNDYIQYNRFFDKIVIWEKGRYTKESIDIIIGNDQNTMKYIRLNVSELPIYDIGKCDENAFELYRRYVKCCYSGGRDNYINSFFYEPDVYTKLRKKQKDVLKSLSLTWYGDSCKMFSKGFRTYKYDNIKNILSDEELGTDDMFEKCLIDFEAYLLSKLDNHSYWYGWHRNYNFKQLCNGDIYFLKYKSKLPMVLLSDVLFK